MYEMMFVVPSRVSETEIEGVQNRVSGLIEKFGGAIEGGEVLGKIRLAYSIDGETHGTYVLGYFSGEGDLISQLDAALKLEDDVLRWMFVKREKGIPKHRFKITSYVAPITPEGKRAVQQKVETPKAAPTPANEESTLSRAELDKKLDEILDGDAIKGV